MGLALGVVFLWLGAALLWVATHGTEAKTPWQLYEGVISGIQNA